jgi:hypothetical protein
MTILANDWAALLELWDKCQHQYRQCLDFHLFYRDSEQVDSWMSRQEVIGVTRPAFRFWFFTMLTSISSLDTTSLGKACIRSWRMIQWQIGKWSLLKSLLCKVIEKCLSTRWAWQAHLWFQYAGCWVCIRLRSLKPSGLPSDTISKTMFTCVAQRFWLQLKNNQMSIKLVRAQKEKKKVGVNERFLRIK